MRHLIQRQEFIFTTPFLQVQEWERRVNELLQRIITPAIENCFDKASSANSYHIIDRLEINLGKINKNISEQQIHDLVTAQLMDKLGSGSYKINNENRAWSDNGRNDQAVATADAGYTAAHPKKYRQEQEAYTAIDDKEYKDGHVLSSSQAHIKCLIYFLVQGRLPWWAEANSFQLKKEWLENATEEELLVIKKVLYENEQSRQRLVRQSGLDFMSTLLRRLDPDHFFAAISTWQWLETSSTVTSGHDLRVLSYEYWFYWINKITGITSETTRLLQAIRQTTHFSKISEIVHYLQQTGSSPHEPVKEIIIQTCRDIFGTTINDQLLSSDKDKIVTENGAIIKQESRQADSPAQDSSLVHKKINNPEEKKTDKKEKPATEIDELFAEDAGLVLLHPFLQELFTGFDLLDAKKQWRSSTAQQTAVWLLVWLAHGETDLPEYRLLIPKLFCGMLWEDVLDTSIVLTEEHIRSATEMLEAVIMHWKTIGNTSPDGLREGFINRSGKIATAKDGWQITVEKKAQDILLGRLPWGLSMIHFPWLDNRFIHVDWA